MAKEEPSSRISLRAANDPDRDEAASRARVDTAVLVIAGLLGRQLAREEFARRQAEAANEDRPLTTIDEDEETKPP